MGYVGSKHSGEVDLDEFLGERATAIKKIAPGKKGRVEFHGTQWHAEADEEIPAGSSVEIIGKQNITLKVKPLERR